ncbi:MAG: T9SS type A sorting domain-containing protein, partial [Ignavibacteria bacterium]|nr:T9SS type A sorting domain-containing protein [Ignavibacteria bacterium]
VENNWAADLFGGKYETQGQEWIKWEVQNIAAQIGNKAYKYLIDESEYNMYPAIGYLNHKIDSLKPQGSKLSAIALNNIVYVTPEQRGLWIDTMQRSDVHSLFQKSEMNEVFVDIYPIYADRICRQYYGTHSYIPNTLPVYDYDKSEGKLGEPENPFAYEDNFNTNIDLDGHHYIDFMKNASYLSDTLNIPLIAAVQIHSWYNGAENLYSLREPTNEEIETLAGIALTYGAKGIIYHSYNSEGELGADNMYGRGLIGNYTESGVQKCGTSKRYINAYRQNKWHFIYNLTAKLKNLGKTVIKFKNSETNSYRYHNSVERNALISSSFVNKIITFRDFGPNTNCTETNIPNSMITECQDETYLQVGTFRTANENERYLMIVNRRTSPDSLSSINGRRYLRIKIDQNSPEFPTFNNWKITDLETNTEIETFDKRQSFDINIPLLHPGEIKLYKFTSVIREGGTLVCGETINSDVTIGGMIYGSGYNFIINEGKTVTFSDGAGIEMNGGVFVCGENSDNADAVTLRGEGNNNIWNGLILNNCDSVGIYNTNITNIKANDTAKAVMLTNCYKSDFRRNTITANNNSGGIQAVFNNVSDDPIILKIRECNFNMNQSGYSAINVISNASVTLPLNIEWCIFNAGNDTSNAVMLSEVTGGVIKNNLFNNYGKSAVFMLSTADLYGNMILGRNNSQGIQCLAGSSISLSPSSGMYLGGYNYIRNYGSSSSNIYSDNSTFYINNGQNDFDLDDTADSKHLTGNINGIPLMYVNAMKNCFHEDSVTNIEAAHTVIWNSTSDPVNFIFTEYNCELTPPGDFLVFQYDNYNDTVYRSPGGEGSGMESKTIDLKTKEKKQENENTELNYSNINESAVFAKMALKSLNILNIEENNYKALRDTININLRKRNYTIVEQKAIQILTQFPDSSASTGMIPKLYVSMLNLDTGGVKAGQLKTFLENLITNNPQNTSLVKSAFYHIQRCKVKLGQYQSALDGFQYIMTQNPYTYEGLIASWDYAATYLLMGSGGIPDNNNINKINTEEVLNTPADTLINRMLKGDINSDRNSDRNSSRNKTNLYQNKQQTGVSNEQSRKEFYEKIKTVNKDSKTIQEEKVKTLEKKIQTSKDDKTKEDAKTELTKMKQINEAVKIKKPDNIKTHTIIINNDIRKVFGIGKKPAKDIITSLVPKTFELYQNYPNPFNPTTKIAFDLPRDAKVKLIIYDILGRELKTLINNEFKSAGKYISEFNGSSLASGIYFARILVNDGKEFAAVKKMVLIK